jgi:DnaJ family protein B protein 4
MSIKTDNYYEILGLTEKASDDEIKKAYKKLALKWHPDRNTKQKELATENFKKISEAYEVLSDPEKKRMYDFKKNGGFSDFNEMPNFSGMDGYEFGGMGGFNGMPKFGKNNKQSFNFTFTSNGKNKPNFNQNHQFGLSDPFEIFNKIFQSKNANVFANHPNTTFSTSTTTYSTQSSDSDDDIKNQRKRFKTNRKNHEVIHSVEVDLINLYTGTKKTFKISDENIIKTFDVEILPGWKEGTKVTFEDDKLGKVIFIIKEKPHQRFKRDGNNLICKEKFSEKKDKIEFMTLTGEIISFNIKNQKKGDKITIHEKGMPIRKNGKFCGYGDLIIELY